jgi:hypothetical protein
VVDQKSVIYSFSKIQMLEIVKFSFFVPYLNPNVANDNMTTIWQQKLGMWVLEQCLLTT